MGRQVNFFMMTEDEHEFIDFLFDNLGCSLLRDLSDKRLFKQLTKQQVLSEPRKHYALVCLEKGTEILPKYIKPCRGRTFDAETCTFFDNKKIHYRLEKSDAPVVELIRSLMLDNGVYGRGRIWASLNEFAGDRFIYKGDGFKRFYEKIARWIINRSIRQSFFYFGKEAYKYLGRGGKFQGYNDYGI